MKSRMTRELVLAALLALAVLTPSFIPLLAQAPPAGFPDLVSALKATPGCLGVEAARTASGKQVIFAWFENKPAVLNWYYSETHQQAMRMFFPNGASGHKPLAEIADDSGPIMAVASLTFADKPQFDVTSLPVSQIAIELYYPLPGGLALGGRFAPDTLKVPGLVESGTRRAEGDSRIEPGTGTVTIKVVGARNAKGKVGVALFQDATGFPEDASKATRQQEVDIDMNTLGAQVVFHDVPLGVYAVSVRHDENMNGKLDKGFMGIPKEGYGASNNPEAKLRAPTFDEAKVALKATEQAIEIRLIY